MQKDLEKERAEFRRDRHNKRQKTLIEVPFVSEILSGLYKFEDAFVDVEVFESEELNENGKRCQYIHLQPNRNLSELRKKSSLNLELDFHAPLG